MNFLRFKILIVLLGAGILVHSCKKDKPANPFDDITLQPPPEIPVIESLDPNGFTYIHKYILKPTCANSGCHDGSFEPDYRTIYSAYNTLVYHPTISNDSAGTFTYRVLPGDANLSMIHERLTTFLPNSSGTMPLSVDPGSDWPANQTAYIQNITNWINNGARDMYGNAPSEGNVQPEVIGIVGFIAGDTTSPLARISGSDSPIGVPQFNTVDLWFSVADDLTNATQITFNQYKLNNSPYEFSATYSGSVQIESPIVKNDFWGSPASFTHKAQINLSSYPLGTYLYVRVYLQDADHQSPVELPSDGSSGLMLTYFSLKII